MTRETALGILGISAAAGAAEVIVAHQRFKGELEESLRRAPTPSLQAKYRQRLIEIEEASTFLQQRIDGAITAEDVANLPYLRKTAEEKMPGLKQPDVKTPPPPDATSGTSLGMVAKGTSILLIVLMVGGFAGWWFGQSRPRNEARLEPKATDGAAVHSAAQVPANSGQAPATAVATRMVSANQDHGRTPQYQRSALTGDAPIFDSSPEVFKWDGESWHTTDNRLFEARFERYLSAPEETTQQDQSYRKIIDTILNDLAPGNATLANVDDAFRLLVEASAYDGDENFCDAIADAIYIVWRAQDDEARLTDANDTLKQDRRLTEWNVKKKVSESESKVKFQALLVQLFLHRRFQHVLIGTRFYEAIFADGSVTSKIGANSNDLSDNPAGVPPTVSKLDSLANQFIDDVGKGVETFQYLVGQNELVNASRRLAESFTTGEYLPELRTLPQEQKGKLLQFLRQSDQLLSALEVKDYTLAQKLVDEVSKTASDFDNSKATAAIETAKRISSLHITKARIAAKSGDIATASAELQAATNIWPRNPEIENVSDMISSEQRAP